MAKQDDPGNENHHPILLVEDNRINQMVVMQLLKRAGLTAEAAGDATEALHLLRTTRYRLVLMDVQLPGIDGIQATRIIRDPDSNVCDHDVPVVAMTAYNSAEDQRACLDAGMNGFLSKPLEIESFLELVKRHTGQR